MIASGSAAATDRRGVEAVHLDRFGAEIGQHRELRPAARRGHDRMAGGDELGDQGAADGSSGTGEEHAHFVLLHSSDCVRTGDEAAGGDVTGRGVTQLARSRCP
jgi:hypothetical protein